MIDYSEDEQLREQASLHDLQAPVLIRDIVRVVELLNLRARQFFNKRSVLAGSMALRCFGSPRFTVYDAVFTNIVLADQDRQFKADISFRGLLLDGREVPLATP
jgi:hypothetical protein